VKSHPASETDTDRGNLAFGAVRHSTSTPVDENAGPTRDPTRRHTEFLERIDQAGLEPPQMVMHIPAIAGIEVHDRIADQLARCVVGDVAATTDLEDIDPEFPQSLRALPEILGIRTPAEGHDGWMFEQKQTIFRQAGKPIGDRGLLELERFAVGDLAQPLDR